MIVAGCSSSDSDDGPPPQQMGNGTPMAGAAGGAGGPGNVFAMGGSAGSSMVPAMGGVSSGFGGTVGAAGSTGLGNGGMNAGGLMGVGGAMGPGGMPAMGGMPAAGGTIATGGVNSMGGSGAGGSGMGGMSGDHPESGRLVGITAAHNAVRAAVETQPPLAALTWSETIAAYAQEWADTLATTSCNSPRHRSSQELQQRGYGENLAAFGSTFGGSTAQDAVDGWASEVDCWTYGTIAGTEQCPFACYSQLNSDGCGHYTQIVWRNSMQIGCGVASCQRSNLTVDIWICNYSPSGNYIGQTPY